MFQPHNIPVSRKFPPFKARNSWQTFLQQNNQRLNKEPCSTTETAPKTGRGRRRFPTLTLKCTNNSGSDLPLYVVVYCMRVAPFSYFQIMWSFFTTTVKDEIINKDNNNYISLCFNLFHFDISQE